MNAKAPQYPPKDSRPAAIPPPPPPTKACKNFGKCNMTPDQAITLLASIDLDDSEQAHIEADRLLLQFLETNGYLVVANAYRRVREQAGFRY